MNKKHKTIVCVLIYSVFAYFWGRGIFFAFNLNGHAQTTDVGVMLFSLFFAFFGVSMLIFPRVATRMINEGSFNIYRLTPKGTLLLAWIFLGAVLTLLTTSYYIIGHQKLAETFRAMFL